MYQDFAAELAWASLHMTRTRAAVAALPDLHGVRLACNMHLDLKMAPLVAGLLDKGADVFLTTCNPTTVQDDVVKYLVAKGAAAHAWRDMSDADWSDSFDKALAWQPTHLCEMGADLTTRLHQSATGPKIVAGLEATGSGINRLGGVHPRYPIFNWDDLPVKEGLHNRHMVGLTAWHTFFQTTHLTLHEKTVIVIGYGLVGQGVAAAAKAYGGQVQVAELNPARALQAKYDGWPVVDLADAVIQADVVATATGAYGVLSAKHLQAMKDGAFILNVGHVSQEIDVPFLKQHARHSLPMPYIDAYEFGGKTLYLLADGSMFNLTAGYGDSLNAFDVTLAVMASGIGHIVGAGAEHAAGLYLLPESAWMPVL
ncbi:MULTISPECIES: adenosylhomocysteinase [Shewanella]|uniref:adenosylhomocysteinase n=1 Tax=Shewanella TaxID=22 RepID=UPI0016746D11|nr:MULTISPECIES: adenosylhomocysteinase [Shewanella]MBO1270859.1 adenosylhomocysteinase [Shewanella sp. 4t3-1-2LB]MCL2907568.1 adenosylhomocysteinase [Shewanella fodinae]GGZ09690.1 adenosylhomocysteinase [Shewanella fodinae]